MTDRELMQMALDALMTCQEDWIFDGEDERPVDTYDEKMVSAAFKALCARLEQPEPEPVAWMYEYGTDNGDAVNKVRWYKNVSLTPPVLTYNRNVVPLYPAPPQREWQGLTDEEIMDACSSVWASHPIEVGQVVQDLLREKNG